MNYNQNDDDLGFNPGEQKDPMTFTPVPTGKYVLQVETLEKKATRAGGKYISIKMRIKAGPFEKRVIFDNMNIEHPTSEKAVEIGRSAFKGLCMAAGVDPSKVTKLSQLLDKVVTAQVGIDNDPNYGDKNVVVSYDLPAKGAKPVTGTATAAQSFTAPAQSEEGIPF